MINLDSLKAAAFRGHAKLDPVAARREAIVEILSKGKPISKNELIAQVSEIVGPCWGKRPNEALLRDLNALRLGGLRIGYSRRQNACGYYLKFPALESNLPQWVEPTNTAYTKMVQALSPIEKLRKGFASAEFAVSQKKLILQHAHQAQSSAEIDQAAREMVYRAHSKSKLTEHA